MTVGRGGRRRTMGLVILHGLGERVEREANGVLLARTPSLTRLFAPNTADGDAIVPARPVATLPMKSRRESLGLFMDLFILPCSVSRSAVLTNLRLSIRPSPYRRKTSASPNRAHCPHPR